MSSSSLSELRVVVREINRRAGDRRITVSYSHEAVTAMASKTGIILPVLSHPVSPEELKLHRYRALHELGHHDRAEVFDLAERAQLEAKAFWMWNLVEDEAQERQTQARWPGDRIALEEGRGIHVYRQLDELKKAMDAGFKPCPDTIKQVAAYTVSLASRDWHRGAEGLFEANRSAAGPEVEALVDELVAEGWHERIGTELTVAEAYDVARDLFIRLYPENAAPPTAEEAQQNEPQNGEENQGDEGESQGKAQQNGEGDEDSSQEQGNDTFTINWDKLLASDHTKMLDPNGSPVRITYDRYHTNGVQFIPDDEININRVVEVYDATLNEPDKALGNQLRRYVQSKSRAKWETERRSGRINKRALKRIVMGTEDRHRRVFQKRTDAEALDTAITLLVDCSGSMGCLDRDKAAAEAAATLVDAFSKVLRIPTEVIGHTYDHRGVELYVEKTFNESRPGVDIGRALLSIDQCGNADGDAIMAAAERLAKRKERRKIMILIADGQPADSHAGNAPGVLKVAVSEVGRMGIELYGIGIGYRELGEFIPEYTYLPDRSPVTPVLLEAVQKFVLKN